MRIETDSLTIIDDELPNIYHVLSKKVGELGIIFLPPNSKKFVFKQTDIEKYLKAWHLANILHEVNVKNKGEL